MESLGYSVTLVEAFADIIFQLDELEDFIVTVIGEVSNAESYRFGTVDVALTEQTQNLFSISGPLDIFFFDLHDYS